MADPLPASHFQVEWGGTHIGFSEVSGLTIEIQPIEYRSGASPKYTAVKLSGIQKCANITFKRGIVLDGNELFEWLNTTSPDPVPRRDLVISLLNEKHEPVMRWKVKNAFPVKIERAGLKATGNEVAIESMEVAHEGLVIENK